MATNTDAYFGQIEKLQDIAYELSSKANACRVLGLVGLYEDLDAMARSVLKSCKFFQDDSIRVSQERFQDAQQATANMLKGMLVMGEIAEIAEREKKNG